MSTERITINISMKIIILITFLLYGCGNISSSFDQTQLLLTAKIKTKTSLILEENKCNENVFEYVNNEILPLSITLQEYSSNLSKEEKEITQDLNNLVVEYNNRLKKESTLFYCKEKAKIILENTNIIIKIFSKRIRR